MINESKFWVVGMDESDGAESALDWCVAAAPGRVGKLHVMQAWQIPAAAGIEFGIDFTDDFRPDVAYSKLPELVERLMPSGVEVEASAVRGGAAAALLAGAEDADLLVVGRRGLGGFKRLLLGSVSQQCATHSRVPVVVVPVAADARRAIHRVVVGVDGSAGSAAALSWALQFAPDDAHIVVVGVWNPSTWAADSADPLELQRGATVYAEIDSVIDAAVEASDRVVQIERDHRQGRPASTLLDSAERADLLVVGERGRTGLSGAVLGSVTTNVLHHATCPVAVIPARES